MYRELMNENRFYSSRYNFRFQKLAFLKSKITRSDGRVVAITNEIIISETFSWQDLGVNHNHR